MDIVSAIGIVISALAMAVSFASVRYIRKQSKIMERQTMFQRSQVYPFLDVEYVKVKGNKISLKLHNAGNSPALVIGLRVSTRLIVPRENEWGLVRSLRVAQGEKQVDLTPEDIFICLKNRKGKTRLHSGHRDIFSGGFLFHFKESKVRWRTLEFAGLTSLLKASRLRFAHVSFRLVYKDLSERILEQEPIDDIVIDIKTHHTMKEASEKRIPFTQKTLSVEEFGWLPWWIYKEGKSPRAFLEEPR